MPRDPKIERIKSQWKIFHEAIPSNILSEKHHVEYIAEREAIRQTPEYIADAARRQLLKDLTKANRVDPNNKIKNTLLFFTNFVKQLILDFNEFVKQKPITHAKLKAFMHKHSAHIDVLKKFDDETPLNAEAGYDGKLIYTLNLYLEKHIPVLAQAFRGELQILEENNLLKGEV